MHSSILCRCSAERQLKGRLLLIGMLALGVTLGPAQEIPQNFSLYSDKKAKRMEDIITVLIVEEAKAKNDTRTETDTLRGPEIISKLCVPSLFRALRRINCSILMISESPGYSREAVVILIRLSTCPCMS